MKQSSKKERRKRFFAKLNEGKHVFKPAQETQDSSRPSERTNNPNKRKEYRERYLESHKAHDDDYFRRYFKKYRKEHAEQLRDVRRRYANKHREQERTRIKEYLKAYLPGYWERHPEFVEIRLSPRYAKWRSDVLQRDNWTCLTCGSKSNLEVHHSKKKFITILKEYNIKNYGEALRCVELWNLDNGATLCEECHDLTE